MLFRSLKRINREISDLTDRLSALQPEVDAAAAPDYTPEPAGSAGDAVAASEPAVSETPEPATTPSEIRTQAGAPFRSIGQAKQAVRARGLDPENFTIRPTDGGFVVVPQETPADVTSAAPAAVTPVVAAQDGAEPAAAPSDPGDASTPASPTISPDPQAAVQKTGETEDAVEGVGAPSTATPTIENVRAKAAVVRGIDQATADRVGADLGISIKSDPREGGFIFSRAGRLIHSWNPRMRRCARSSRRGSRTA